MTFRVNIDVLKVDMNTNITVVDYRELLNPSLEIVSDIFQCKLNKNILNNGHCEFVEIFGFKCCLSIFNGNMRFTLRKKNDNKDYVIIFRTISKELYINYHNVSKIWTGYLSQITQRYVVAQNIDCTHLESDEDIIINVELGLSDVYSDNADDKGKILFDEYTKDTKIRKIEPISISLGKWRLPSMTTNESNLICYGFIREHCKKWKKYIPSDIIELCIIFIIDDIDHIQPIANGLKKNQNIKHL